MRLSASFLSREYSPILFRAQINAFKMLQASIPFLRTLVFCLFRDFNDFYLHKASVSKAHLPNCDFLLRFCSGNTAQYFFLAQINALKMLQGSVHPAKPPYFGVFRNFNNFFLLKASVGEAHLPNCDFLLRFCRENTAQYYFEP